MTKYWTPKQVLTVTHLLTHSPNHLLTHSDSLEFPHPIAEMHQSSGIHPYTARNDTEKSDEKTKVDNINVQYQLHRAAVNEVRINEKLMAMKVLTHSLTHSLIHSLTHSPGSPCCMANQFNCVITRVRSTSMWHAIYLQRTRKRTWKSVSRRTEPFCRTCASPRNQSMTRKAQWSSSGMRWTSRSHSLTHLLTHSLTHLLTHSLTHLLTHLLTYLLTHSLTHLLTYSLTYLLTYLRTYVYLLTHSLTYLLTYLLLGYWESRWVPA